MDHVTTTDEGFTYPLQNISSLDPLMDLIGDVHHILLGEASHGTHEYYSWRAAISKRLIVEKGINFIAVEGDWPDCYKINRYIKGYADRDKKAVDLLKEFDRWPTWMWANWETVSLIEWLKIYNSHLNADQKVGFYGLDVYSLWDSMNVIMKYLSIHDAKALKYAKKALQCFEPFGQDEQLYANAQYSVENSCQDAVVQLLVEIRQKAPIFDLDPEAALNIEQNAEVVVNAENYYRNMITINNDTWNLRDHHMMDAFNRLLEFHGSATKAVIWAHNTHVGDARFTNMAESGDINLGQLVREQKGENNTVLVGFGSYSGKVIAGDNWGAPIRIMTVPDARAGSIEALLHLESAENRLLIFDKTIADQRFNTAMPHRAIGVVYNPAYERYGNYVPTILNARYDGFMYMDRTKALHALHIKPNGHKIPETYPFEF